METPYLTEKTCRKRFLGFSLPIPLIGMVLCVVALLWKPMIVSGLLAGLLIGSGPLLGGTIAWFRLKIAVRNGAQIVDPWKAQVPSEVGLFLWRHRFVGSVLCWLLATSILVFALVGGAPEEMRFVTAMFVGFFSLFTGFNVAIQYWGMRHYARLFQKSLQAVPLVKTSEESAFEQNSWWTQEETRQEIRRR